VEVDQTYLDLGEDGNIATERPLTDEAVVNNSAITNWIMTFLEFYLAYKLASSEEAPQVLLLDRSLLTMVSSLIDDTRRRRIWKASALIGLEIEGETIDEVDIQQPRQLPEAPDHLYPHHYGGPEEAEGALGWPAGSGGVEAFPCLCFSTAQVDVLEEGFKGLVFVLSEEGEVVVERDGVRAWRMWFAGVMLVAWGV